MSTPTPVRLQRSRKKGSRLVSPNGLPIRSVSRPGKFGNPYPAGKPGPSGLVIDKEGSVGFFRMMLRDPERRAAAGYPPVVPWNKGLSVRLSPKSEFKPGTIRGRAARNWCAVGTVKVMNGKNGPRNYVKVRDDGPRYGRWIPVARRTWEAAHGPLLPGYTVVHVGKDKLDDSLGNLACLSRAGMMLHNSWRNDPEKHREKINESLRTHFAIRREAKVKRAADVTPPAKVAVEVPKTAKDVARARVASFLAGLDETAAANNKERAA